MPYVEGLIRSVLFYREENGYTVLKLEIIDTTEMHLLYHEPTIVISGFFPKLETQARYKFYGEIVDHPKYGTQYKAQRFERVLENTKEGIIEYLASGLFKGIGLKTAEKIVTTLGLDCLDQIANDVSVLDKVKKMSKEKKQEIHQTLVDNRQMESTLIWLYGFEISPKMSMRIVNRYGHKTVDILKQNPYILIDDVEGIGFKRADEIGLKMGFAFDSPLRIRAVIFYLMYEYMNKFGDTLLDQSKLMEYTLSFLRRGENEVTKETIQSILQQLIDEERLVEIGDVVMLRHLYEAEVELAKKIRQYHLLEEETWDEATIKEAIQLYESNGSIQYTSDQRKAIYESLKHSFVIITGGPGTGKTTIVKAVVDLFMTLSANKKTISQQIKLVAPTGKAAKRLSEATQFEATTIHRLLGYDFTGTFSYHADAPLDCRLLIIDEASMMDILLAKALFEALPKTTKVIIVGDEYQLPSVGPGQVLADLIACGHFPVIHLTKIHRQAAGSKIIDFAYQILHQELSEQILTSSSELSFIRSKESDVLDHIINLVKRAITHGYDLHEDIQILIPMYKGSAGIDLVNEQIQALFQAKNHHQTITSGSKTFALNDKVIQLVNQPEDGIMNGDIGKVVTIIENLEMIVEFNGNQVRYNTKDFENIALAYAVSVHKAQGSEFKMVLFPVVSSHWMMLKRKLIYTAVTRAKEHLIIIGDPYSLRQGIMGEEPIRNTLLKQWLTEEMDVRSTRTVSMNDILMDE